MPEGFRCRFRLEDLTVGTLEQRAVVVNILVQRTGVLTPNEGREIMGSAAAAGQGCQLTESGNRSTCTGSRSGIPAAVRMTQRKLGKRLAGIARRDKWVDCRSARSGGSLAMLKDELLRSVVRNCGIVESGTNATPYSSDRELPRGKPFRVEFDPSRRSARRQGGS